MTQAHGVASASVSGLPRLELSRLWKDFLPLARKDVLGASLILNLTALALPLVVLQIYDRIIPYAATGTLTLLVGGLVVALAIDAMLRAARNHIAGWAGAKFEHAAGVQAVERILAADLATIEATPAGVHLDRLTSVDPVRDFYASQASLVLVDLPFALLFVALLGLIGGSLVFVPLLLLVVFATVALLLGRRLRDALDRRSELDDRRYNFIIEVLRGIRTVKGLAMEQLMQRRYERLMERCAGAGYRVGHMSSLAQSIGSAFSQITMMAVAAIGSLYVIAGDITIGALAAATLLAGRMVQPVLRALGIWSRFQSIRVAESRLAEIDAMPVERAAEAAPPPIEALTLDSATVRFAGRDRPVLDDIHFHVRRGEIVALGGRNGAGKSTLLWALMGGVEFDRGALLVNGVPAENYDVRALRQQIAYLPQSPVLFRGTALDNLTGFRGAECREEALRLAAALGLDQVFAKMPNGYETQLGNGSTHAVAAGVAQRIAVVRALVRAPRVILFDEANTALDHDADRRLAALLAAAGSEMAVVVVSHRPSLLSLAGRHYVLEDGRMNETSATGAAASEAAL